MIDELATLINSRELFASREDSDISPGSSPHESPEHTLGTHNADAPSAVWKPCDERPQVAPAARIGKCLVVALSGSDDQAQVFRVRRSDPGREFVLKLYSCGATDNPATRERLLREGRLLVDCRHRNLLEVVEVDLHEGHPFVVTESVQGLSLTDYIRQRRPGVREAAGLVIELARAVEFIHSRGIIHQDLTPSDVLIDETGRPKLMNFDLARLRAAWSLGADGPLGSSTAEPSRRRVTGHDEPVGPATDVFGLGIVLKHVLMGQLAESRLSAAPPLGPDNQMTVLPSRTIPPRVPRALRLICEKAMAHDPNRRYQSAAELRWALRRYRSRRWFAWTASLILAALAAVFLAGS
jgi:serine/threonine protein kinase